MGKTQPRRVNKSSSWRCIRKNSSCEKSSQKSKITADRLTLLPGFLSKEVKCGDTSTNDENDSPLEEKTLRRSWRLCVKNQPVTVSGYFNKLVKDRSKSIFKEIQEKVREKEENINASFQKGLFENLDNFQLKDTDFYRKEIEREVLKINNILLGKEMAMNRKRGYNEDEKENCPIKFPYIPQSRWVFHTPPNRKLNFNHVKVEDNLMQPAVIERRNDKKIVYELNKNFNVDLTNFSSKDEITIDKRFMVEVTGSVNSQDEEEKMDYNNGESYELENYFLSLTCRPKKKHKTLPRTTSLRRCSSIFDPRPGCSTDVDDYKPNDDFVENLNDLEETFTFKFTSNDDSEGATTGHLFDCDGNKKNTFNFRF